VTNPRQDVSSIAHAGHLLMHIFYSGLAPHQISNL